MKNTMNFTKYLLLSAALLAFSGLAGANWIAQDFNQSTHYPTATISDAGSGVWQMSLQVPGIEHKSVLVDGRTVDQLEIPGERISGLEGEALLPQITRVLALQSSGDPELEVLSENWVELEGTYELALNRDGAQANALSDVYMTRDSFLPASPIMIDQVQSIGGIRIAAVRINAARYNPVRGKVELLQNADIRIRETGSTIDLRRPITETNAMQLRPLVENWNALGLDEFVVRGSVLCIYDADLAAEADAIPHLNRLKTWYNRKGYTVEEAVEGDEIASWTTTGIKAYIQNRYNNAEPPLEYVVLIGDANGTYFIPGFDSDFEGEVSIGDWEYTQLDGTDLLSDVGLGRYCFQSIDKFQLQVNRLLSYERTPSAVGGGSSNPDWYKGGSCIATSSSSGISTVQTMRTVRARMMDAGFASADIDTFYYIHDYINATDINNSFNAGVSLWCHRGYASSFPWSSSDETGMLNAGRWPFAINITCGMNDYDACCGPDREKCEQLINAGTPATPKGVIAVIGTSSYHTNTRYNNAMMAGGVQGLLIEGVTKAGAILNRSRFELYYGFPVDSAVGRVQFFYHITNLLGDPTVDIFTDTPDNLSIDNPSTARVGLNSLTLTVTNQLAQPVEKAYVQLNKGTEVFEGDWTNAAGQVTLNFITTSADTLFVTATKHNCRPAIDTTLVQSGTGYIAPANGTYVINDDNVGTSSGNANGVANPGETIELAVPLRNWGTTSVTSVVATLSSSDPFVTAISDNSESHGTITAGSTSNPSDDFDFTVASYVPDGHVLQFTITVTGAGPVTFVNGIGIAVANGNYEYSSHTLAGVGDTQLDPGESGSMTLTLKNEGTAAAAVATAYLRSLSSVVTITDSVGSFTAAAVNANSTNAGNTFGLSAASDAYPGELATLMCIFPLASGFADTVYFDITIGSGSSSTPTPPDAYGYWAFDNTDTGYDKAPVYAWVEIDPEQGGDGTVVSIIDAGDEADMSAVVALPFTFQYYGQDFTDISVCSNGWLAMGADQVVHNDFRNYAIPSAVGPTRMIAPFWDDLLVNPGTRQTAGSDISDRIDPVLMQQEIEQQARVDEIESLKIRMENATEDELRAIKTRLVDLNHEMGLHNRPEHPEGALDQGSETCAGAIVISSFPYHVTGTTVGYATDCENTGSTSPTFDVFYVMTTPEAGEYTFDMCGSEGDSYLKLWLNGTCCSGETATNDDNCGDYDPFFTLGLAGGQTVYVECGKYHTEATGGAYNLNISYAVIPLGRCCYGSDPMNPQCQSPISLDACYGLSGSWTEGLTCEASPCPPPQPDGIFTKHDAANHRFIIQWSRVQKYGGGDPEETFQAILYEPGYPETPTGDGEILFQYYDVTNTTDTYASNDYCTVGIENLDNSDGVMYSYWNRQDPQIPGSAGIISGRAILFTTQRNIETAATPASPASLTAVRTTSGVGLSWDPVTEDILGNPITVDGYHIYGGTTADAAISGGTYLGSTAATTYTDTNALTRDIYFYIVVAYVNP